MTGSPSELTGEEVRRCIARLRHQLAAQRVIHGQVEGQLIRQIGDLQERCSHEHTTYYPDPSGNNDSSTDCDDCGAEWSRRTGRFERTYNY